MKNFKKFLSQISNFLFAIFSFPFVLILFLLDKANKFMFKYSLLRIIYLIILGISYQCIIFARLLSFSFDLKQIVEQFDKDLQILKKYK